MSVSASARSNTIRLVCALGATMLFCPLLSGCGTSAFTDRGKNPMIQDTTTAWLKPLWEDQSVDVFATTASRRTILVKENDHDNILEACAEPPPDVAESFSEAIAAGFKAAVAVEQGTDTKIGGSLAGQYARELATQVAPLLYRTQGLQVLRDSQYTLCVDRMSGYINEEDYIQKKDNRFKQALLLIALELPVMKEAQKAFFEHWKTSTDKATADEAIKLMQAIDPTAPAIPTLPSR
jgi:hypothetical protein